MLLPDIIPKQHRVTSIKADNIWGIPFEETFQAYGIDIKILDLAHVIDLAPASRAFKSSIEFCHGQAS